ncbi:uncharacterized protein LOC124438867 [Xenia sp. Carnegie-2017]|uniref:uncharacterized protein LOC124438867 n=1 Tax=Xenia sp. Carnegie-2017 TaxID=2897299 RepID=UPI001F03AA81|nr:uncharacterized protein LOC124438867 [Xenia sp. Carnegie-2017]
MAQPQEKNQLLLLKVVGLLDDFTTLFKKIALLVDVKALLNLIDKIGEISCLSIIRNEKYAELMKGLCNLADECKILVVDARNHINNIKKQAQDAIETIESLKQAFINSSNVSGELKKIKSSVMESLKESEKMCQRYHEIYENLNEYCGQAKVECIRNESIAGIAEKGMIAGAFGWLSIYGGYAGYQFCANALFAFGPACAVVGGALSLLGGGSLIQKEFQGRAKKFNELVEGLWEIDKKLLKHYKVMKEHDGQLGKLGKLSETIWARSNAFDEQEPKERDKMNNEFVLKNFDGLKKAYNDLKENCDNVLSQFDTYTI